MAMDGIGAAQDEARRLKDYAEAAADWFWEMDAALRFVRMSASSHLPDGAFGADFIGHRIEDVPGAETVGNDQPPLRQLLESRLPFRDIRLIKRSEAAGPVHLSLSGLPVFEGGMFCGYRGIGRDLTLLKRAEEELAETSALLRVTLQNMGQGLMVLDQDLRLRLWNDELRELFRHEPSALWRGRPFADLIRNYVGAAPGQVEDSIAHFQRVLAAQQPAERTFTVPDGRIIEIRVVPTPMPMGGLIATYRDVTERTRAANELAAATSLLRDTLDNMGQGLLVMDEQLRIRLWNDRLYQLFAHKPEQFWIGRPAFDLIDENAGEDAATAAAGKALLLEAIEQRRPVSRELSLWHGAIVEMRLTPMPNGGLIATYLDVTERTRAQRELAAATSLLRATLDNMEQGLLLLDGQLRVRLWNDKFYQLFGHKDGQLWVGRPLFDLIDEHNGGAHPDDAKSGKAFLRAGIEERRAISREVELPLGYIIEMRLTPMPDGGLLATYLDVTEHKKTELDLRHAKEEAELASRSKSEFLANMSHELRTPLNAIIGFADILQGQIFGKLGDPHYVEYAADIRDSGQHLLKLINDVLDVSKVEFGKVELTEESVDMAAVVDSCVRLMRGRVEVAGLALTCTVPRSLPLVHCDELRMKQILLNLLSNAVKFTQNGGRILVEVTLDERGLGIAVEDSGIGIADGDLDKALRPFGQIDSRLARKFQGTGLGLPLAKSMIELHGGRLDIASKPGVGTRATVWLPNERILLPA